MSVIRTKFSSSNEVSKLTENSEVVQMRLRQIDDLMRKQTCYQLRDDSKLAFLVAKGDLTMPDDVLVQEMAIIQWVSENTEYHRVLEQTIKIIGERVKLEYGIQNWNTVWKIVREFVPDIVKYYMIEKHGGIPDLKKRSWADMEDEDNRA